MDAVFLQARITATQAQIIAFEELLLKLAANPQKSYTVNTGQTTESVTRADSDRIQALISSLYQQLDFLESRQSGATLILRPGF